jgi:hypothetical protein
MSVLLFVVGAIAVMAGAALIAVGIPINEFSFGNTLIAAGATSVMGGLIILGLGAVVAQLQRVVEALATRPPLRTSRPLEPFEQPTARPSTSRIPFPSRPKAVDHAAETLAPTLHNPDEAPVAVEESEELPLSPRAPSTTAGMGAERRPLNADWRASPPPMPPAKEPQTAFFDAMWPATGQRPGRPPVLDDAKSQPNAAPASPARTQPQEDSKPEPKYEPKFEPRFAPKLESKAEAKLEPKYDLKPETTAPEPDPVRADPDAVQLPPSEMRAVAILKSGMVDGMSYTLYVDGSIEAELPQGTLRFASINELRSHLEKTS